MNGKETVLEKFDVYGGDKPHWKIYYGNSPLPGNLIESTEIYEDKGLDKATSKQKLQDALDRLTPGEYLIQMKGSSKANTQIVRTDFKIGYTSGAPAVNGTTTNTNIPGGDWIRRADVNDLVNARIAGVEAKFEKKMLATEMEELRKEMKELKKNGGGGLSELANTIKEVVVMVKGMSGAPVHQPIRVLAGSKVQPATQTRTQDQEKEALERRQYFSSLNNDAVKELMDDEGGGEEGFENVCVLIWCLNEYRKENPAMWDSVKPEILKHAEKLDQDAE